MPNDGLYPDIEAAGGLSAALQAELQRVGSDLQVSNVDEVSFISYAHVESGFRSSQVFLAANERLFVFDCWSRGVLFGNGKTQSLNELARAINRWVGTTCKAQEITDEFKCV